MNTPREVSRQTFYTGKFLKYEVITWEDAAGVRRQWETVERTTGLNAVLIIPWMRPSNRLVLIRQFRPPANTLVIEFPAGLIEPGETPEAAAEREMREEAGFACRIIRSLPDTYNSPGLSGETVFNVEVEVADGTPHEPCPDDGENIELLLVNRSELGDFVAREIAAGHRFDSKVWAYLQGFLTAGGC